MLLSASHLLAFAVKQGTVSLANTHPFVRELWGRNFVFAHNGTVKAAKKHPLGRFHPIGETDSEHAFCVIMDALARAFPRYPRVKRDLWEAVAEVGPAPRPGS